jgi:formimidoylglutamase
VASGGHRSGPSLGVVGVPLSRTSISPSGAHTTPGAVRAALRRFSTLHAGLDVDLETLSVTDHGDLPVEDATVDDHLSRVEQGLLAVASAGHDLVVVLGGDNAVTRPALRALLPVQSTGLLTLDAHHDVRGFHDGATNGTPVRGLVEDGLRGDHVVQIGIGTLTNSRAYRDWCEDRGITLVGVDECRGQVGAVVRRHLDRLAESCEHLYVDLDVDVLDAAFAPGCPGARPGGLAPWELLEAAVEAGRHPAVRVVDVTEVDAVADLDGRTVDVAAQCLLSAAAGLAART